MTARQPMDQDGDNKTYTLGDPAALGHNMLRLMSEGSHVFNRMLEKSNGGTGPYSVLNGMSEAAGALAPVARAWSREPAKLIEAQGRLMQGYMDLWGRSIRRMLGDEVEPAVEPERGDNRFKDPEWSENPVFDFWKQAYLLTANWVEDTIADTEGLEPREKQRAEFYAKLIASALAPSNFPVTNPEVLRETLATSGDNLLKGLENLSADLERSNDILTVSQTDADAFEIGRNLAVTPGKVVFQNDLIQLIQYTPTTETVHDTPLLIVPPWINKYYILDLVPEKSFVKWAVDQGFTVFVISWVNPGPAHAHKTFEDYMREGVMAALGPVTQATGARQANVLGYCVGGTLLACTLAYMAAKGDDRIRSATFLAAQVDFQNAGNLLVFIDDTQLKALEEMMAEVGYLDGSRMAAVFNMLRARDLIWPYVVNNYLLGRKPMAFDLLYWNSDSTRMPAANHRFYLTEFYRQNNLAKGKLKLGGVTLDLKTVDMPIYELATREDHIAPAQSIFTGAKLFGGPVRFVLAGSGHIAGVVNPPGKVKYQHWIGPTDGADSVEDWLQSATERPGSWWPDWAAWLAERSGDKVLAEERQPGKGPLPALEDAPGTYVKTKGADQS